MKHLIVHVFVDDRRRGKTEEKIKDAVNSLSMIECGPVCEVDDAGQAESYFLKMENELLIRKNEYGGGRSNGNSKDYNKKEDGKTIQV